MDFEGTWTFSPPQNQDWTNPQFAGLVCCSSPVISSVSLPFYSEETGAVDTASAAIPAFWFSPQGFPQHLAFAWRLPEGSISLAPTFQFLQTDTHTLLFLGGNNKTKLRKSIKGFKPSSLWSCGIKPLPGSFLTVLLWASYWVVHASRFSSKLYNNNISVLGVLWRANEVTK